MQSMSNEVQFKWLEDCLRKDADVSFYVYCSSGATVPEGGEHSIQLGLGLSYSQLKVGNYGGDKNGFQLVEGRVSALDVVYVIISMYFYAKHSRVRTCVGHKVPFRMDKNNCWCELVLLLQCVYSPYWMSRWLGEGASEGWLWTRLLCYHGEWGLMILVCARCCRTQIWLQMIF